jgi:uncharacterized protein (DUF342 family)
MVKSPISFKDFSKDPVKGLLFMVILAVGYLYIDNKTNYTSQIEKCEKNVSELNLKVDKLQDRVHRSDSVMAVASARLEAITQITSK